MTYFEILVYLHTNHQKKQKKTMITARLCKMWKRDNICVTSRVVDILGRHYISLLDNTIER